MIPPLILGALLAMTAVMAGALGAHGLRAVLDARGLEVFGTAVTYQFYHAIALIVVALLSGAGLNRRLLAVAAGFFVAGTLLFSGSLYLLVLTELRWVGPLTPVGGVCFLVGWALMVVSALRRPGLMSPTAKR
ncbi:DUF423 domain-containing protein [Marinobacter salinisoli]|uniref:DUF423 domain-containing protein n=1 Tax=Marinobacter salinisoli TaxID=2769486 RepID=A0ABX7MSF4_9GAMM|nr:DUF423 domain-containing protein [Marinobacter salinisoli]QSP95214.1 DUF423 domain-containing protein [Marinobacter salinisoli]